jgi:hypothetical protein
MSLLHSTNIPELRGGKHVRASGILLLDPLLDGLLTPFIVPIIKFWVDQKIEPLLFGYAIGVEAALVLLFYQALEWLQKRRRIILNNPAYIQSVPFAAVLVSTALAYTPVLLYLHIGVNIYFVIAIFTGSFYFFCVRNHLAYLKRCLFSPEQRELFDRKADKLSHVTRILSMGLLALVFIDPAELNPVKALVFCFFISDIGLLSGFTYFHFVIKKEAKG